MAYLTNMFLDDLREPPVGNWTVVRSVSEAMKLLRTGLVDHASLDHDLGECADCVAKRGYADPTKTCIHVPTGQDLCEWMADTGYWPRHKPLVHSANQQGKHDMELTISRHFPKR